MDRDINNDFDFEKYIIEDKPTEDEPEKAPALFIKDLPLTDRIKKELYDYVDYMKRVQDSRLCNCALIGCPERFAERIIEAVAAEVGIDFKSVNVDDVKKPGDFAYLVTNLNPGDLLAVSDVSQLNPSVKNTFLQIIRDYSIDVVTGKGSMAASYHLPLPYFTFIIPVKSRQDIPAGMEESIYYEIDFSRNRTDLKKGIILDILQKDGLTITDEAAEILAGYEISDELLRSKIIKVRNHALVSGTTVIGTELLDEKVSELPGLNDVDSMEGRDFEVFTADLLTGNGFTNIRVTPSSGDFGADVIAEKEDVRYAIQCKRYDSPVGVTAVQEVMASKSLHDCHVACVLTNSTYTPSAVELAKKNLVILWDRMKLKELIDKAVSINKLA